MSLLIVSVILSMVISLLSGVVYIGLMHKKLYGQEIRDCLSEQHAKKAGTPTTGGFFIVVSAIMGALLVLVMAQKLSTASILVILTFLFYMFAGLMDDIIKIKQKHNEGLTPRGKLFLQMVIALLPALYVTGMGSTWVNLGVFTVDLGYLYPIFAVLMITGASNAVNLTDGLDGLAGTNIVISLIACAVLCYIAQMGDISILALSVVGATIGFLYYNKYPAKIFMGDTGSLALGGFLGAVAVMGKFELWLIPIGIIYILETLSVIFQVLSFKLTGKRIFKMSPLHHHFEMSGWSENKIVIVSAIVTLLFSVGAIYLYLMSYKLI